MPIDASIYQTLKPVEIPSVMDQYGKAMSLRQLGLQGEHTQNQIAKDEQEAQALKKSLMTKEAVQEFKYLSSLPEDQRAKEYTQKMQKLAGLGMPTENMIKGPDGNFLYDPNHFSMQMKGVQTTPEWRQVEEAEAKLANTKADTAHKLAQAKSGGSGAYDPYKMLRLEKLQQEIEDRKFAKTPEGRLSKMGGEERKRFDNAKLGMISVQGMADALNAGDNTFRLPLTGDNDFTQQRTLFEEALGRMQSGGAISKEEEKRFRAMAPTAFDSKTIQLKKLAQLQDEMKSRLGTLGFAPEDAGLAVKEIGVSNSPKFSDPLMPNANAGTSAPPSTGPHGPFVVQGDHKYNWNPKTGKYE